MKIAFRSENGLCPYFIYKNIKFYIQDKRRDNGYVYYLCSKEINPIEVRAFDTHELALEYVKSIERVNCIYDNRQSQMYLYTAKFKEYYIRGKELTIRNADKIIAGSFDSYKDCLEYSKEYVIDYIRTQEPEQLSFI